VYAEGGDFGYSNRTNEFWPYFGCSYLGDGAARTTGNVQTLAGQAGTFADGMSFGYPYQGWPDSYVDEIGENGGSLYLRCQSGTGRAVHYENANYRTIFSAVVFSALGGDDRPSLMAAYINYLTTGLGIEETPGTLRPFVQVRGNPVPRAGVIEMRVSTGIDRLEVLDASGRVIAVPAVRDEAASWNLRDRSGGIVPAGTYFLRATGPGGAATNSFVVLR
jgi:hypothetical protein